VKEDLRISDSNFEEEVTNSPVPVMVDFWASWCLPSQMMMPVLDKLSEEYKNKKIKIKKINVDQNPGLRDKYKIMGCPTFILIKNGVEIVRKVGALSDDQLREIIDAVL
jgi:thioredoxin 1